MLGAETLKRAAFELFPPLEASVAAGRIERKRELEIEKLGSTSPRYGEWFRLSVEKLDELISREHERADAIEKKASGLGAVLTLGGAIGGALGKFVIDSLPEPGLKSILSVGLLLSMGFVLWGGGIGLFAATKLRARTGYGPDWELELLLAKHEAKQPRVEVLVDFELSNLLRNNEISSALGCVRNGLIIFAVTLAVAIGEPLFADIGNWAHAHSAGPANRYRDTSDDRVPCNRLWVDAFHPGQPVYSQKSIGCDRADDRKPLITREGTLSCSTLGGLKLATNAMEHGWRDIQAGTVPRSAGTPSETHTTPERFGCKIYHDGVPVKILRTENDEVETSIGWISRANLRNAAVRKDFKSHNSAH